MLDEFLPRAGFSSYEEFLTGFRITVPERFNFAYDVVDRLAREDRKSVV
jgi:acetyl-CoA synthetase